MSTVEWIVYLAVLAALVSFMVMRRKGQVPRKQALDLVRRGAVIVDVRSAAEFSAGHLSQAFNMPASEIAALLPGKVRDKNHVILLHCQSGMRSKKAKLSLTSMGYTQVFDLGSYERAFKIVSGRSL
jgi:rhodanese-related sulfurtransferase